MMFQTTTFDRLFSVALSGIVTTETSFGFESNGKRHFVVTVPGRPRIEQGMTVIALLKKPNDWSEDSLLGWIDSADGSLVCWSPGKMFGNALLNVYFAIVFPIWAYKAIVTPANANITAFLIAAMFSGFACRSIYLSAEALLVKRALATVRDSIKPSSAECWANTAVERAALPQSGSRPSP